MSSPLLGVAPLPPFSKIKPSDVVPAITALLEESRASIDRLLQEGGQRTWETLIAPLEDIDDRLNRAWSPVSHLNAVANSDEMREAYNHCLPLLSEYATEVGQNDRLFEAYRAIKEGSDFESFEPAQQKIIENSLRDFRLSGVDLPAEKKDRFKAIALELSNLGSTFQDHVLDATMGFHRHLEEESILAGIPEAAREAARQKAASMELSGWVFTLDFPSYIAIMTHADSRELRREFYTAYATRASDQGPGAGQWDNSEVMEKILVLR
ncbi:MAG: oligopeptidase A, partial [Gammaproteobacteria bacterium]|nr:oligopeptidase A [Gammaproteobacteria bacterium]